MSLARLAPQTGCLVAGVVAAAGFGSDPAAPGLLWLLPILALAALFATVATRRPGAAAACGYAYGLGLFAAGAGWTWASLHNYGHLALPLAAGIAGLLVAALALYCLAATGVAAALGRGRPAAVLVALPGCWLFAEYLRGKLFTGFSWLAAGYSQAVDSSPLAGWIPVVGISGTGAITAAVAAAIAAAVVLAGRRTRALALALIGVQVAAGYALARIEWTSAAGAPIAASILQAAIPQQRQWQRDNLDEIPRRYLALAGQARGRLLIMPEGSIPGVLPDMRPDVFGEPLNRLLAGRGATAIVGAFGRVEELGRHTNSAFVLAGSGIDAEYRKRKLTPYGEYLPFADVFEPLLQRARIPFSRLVAGRGDGRVDLGFVAVGMSICYEDAFASLMLSNDAPIMVTITNDSWFDGTVMPAQHLQIASARAREAGRWLLRASNTGPSAAIDERGRVVALAEPGRERVLEVQAVPRTGATFYRSHRDWPALAAGALLLLAAAALARKK